MSFKEDPLQQSNRSPRTLWLGPENMAEARDNFWQAYLQMRQAQPAVEWREDTGHGEEVVITRHVMSNDEAKAVWDIAWAASIAAFSFVMEGRTQP